MLFPNRAFTSIATQSRLAPFSQALLAYLLIPAMFGWFAFVLVDGAQELRSNDLRMPSPSVYDPYLDDFVVFYSAGTLVTHGDGVSLYELKAIHSEESRNLNTTPDEILLLPFFTPPFAVLILTPLALVGLPTAAVIWTALGLSSVAGSALALFRSRGVTPTAGLGWGLAIASSAPFFQTLLHGQTTFFLVTSWTMVWVGGIRGRNDWLAAGGLTLIAHKPQLAVVPVAFLLLTGRWQPVAKAALMVSALTLLTVVVTGWRLLPDYVRLLLNATTWDDKNGISTWGMFGWNAFSRGLLGEREGWRLALTAALDLATVAIVVAGQRVRDRATSPEAVFGMLVFSSLLLSPHVYQHDVLLAAVPTFLLATTGAQRSMLIWTAYALGGWFVLYFHFNILTAISVNASSLWLCLGLLLAALSPATPPHRSARLRQTQTRFSMPQAQEVAV